MLLNRVLCVTGLYFSPFNDGPTLCAYVHVWVRLISLAENCISFRVFHPYDLCVCKPPPP